MISGVRAILFDVLHTLVDDSGFPRYQLREILASGGIDLDGETFNEVYSELTAREYDWEEAAVEEPFRTMKDRHRSRLRALYEHFGITGVRDLEADMEFLWEKIATSRPYPEVSEVLPTLAERGYRLALVSNADEDDPVIRALFGAAIPVDFDAVETSQGAGSYKPDAVIFERVLRKLNLELEPASVVLVGDSPASDMLGAHRAGMRTIWVNRKGIEFPDGYPEPGAVIPDLRGLLELLPG